MQILKRIAPLAMLGALALCFSSTASAAMSLSNGVYGEVNVGYGNVDNSNTARDDGLAAGAILGYKFLQYWAVEGGFTQMPSSNVSTYLGHIAFKGIYPLGDGSWDVFGKVGGAYVRGQRNNTVAPDTAGAFYYGGGFSYWFQQDFGAILQAAGTTSNGNVPSTYSITTGLTYFF